MCMYVSIYICIYINIYKYIIYINIYIYKYLYTFCHYCPKMNHLLSSMNLEIHEFRDSYITSLAPSI